MLFGTLIYDTALLLYSSNNKYHRGMGGKNYLNVSLFTNIIPAIFNQINRLEVSQAARSLMHLTLNMQQHKERAVQCVQIKPERKDRNPYPCSGHKH